VRFMQCTHFLAHGTCGATRSPSTGITMDTIQ
jgi:hypothetical protein